MKLKFLLIGTSLFLIPSITYAQCSPAQSCAELGYKETTNKGGCLKCPFGNGWYCPAPEEEKTVLGECTGYAKNCTIGQILNSDGTCTTDKVSGKTPIGVVVYIGSDNCGQALALKDLGNMEWGGYGTDIPDLPNYSSSSAAEQDFDSCGNTQKIIKQGNANKYPAAWATVDYAPSSVPATKGKWCLPAAGVAHSMMNNYDKINSGLSKAGGESLPTLSDHNHWNWSSSEYSYDDAWVWCYACGRLANGYYKYNYGYVRPVLAF